MTDAGESLESRVALWAGVLDIKFRSSSSGNTRKVPIVPIVAIIFLLIFVIFFLAIRIFENLDTHDTLIFHFLIIVPSFLGQKMTKTLRHLYGIS